MPLPVICFVQTNHPEALAALQKKIGSAVVYHELEFDEAVHFEPSQAYEDRRRAETTAKIKGWLDDAAGQQLVIISSADPVLGSNNPYAVDYDRFAAFRFRGYRVVKYVLGASNNRLPDYLLTDYLHTENLDPIENIATILGRGQDIELASSSLKIGELSHCLGARYKPALIDFVNFVKVRHDTDYRIIPADHPAYNLARDKMCWDGFDNSDAPILFFDTGHAYVLGCNGNPFSRPVEELYRDYNMDMLTLCLARSSTVKFILGSKNFLFKAFSPLEFYYDGDSQEVKVNNSGQKVASFNYAHFEQFLQDPRQQPEIMETMDAIFAENLIQNQPDIQGTVTSYDLNRVLLEERDAFYWIRPQPEQPYRQAINAEKAELIAALEPQISWLKFTWLWSFIGIWAFPSAKIVCLESLISQLKSPVYVNWSAKQIVDASPYIRDVLAIHRNHFDCCESESEVVRPKTKSLAFFEDLVGKLKLADQFDAYEEHDSGSLVLRD